MSSGIASDIDVTNNMISGATRMLYTISQWSCMSENKKTRYVTEFLRISRNMAGSLDTNSKSLMDKSIISTYKYGIRCLVFGMSESSEAPYILNMYAIRCRNWTLTTSRMGSLKLRLWKEKFHVDFFTEPLRSMMSVCFIFASALFDFYRYIYIYINQII